MSNLPLGAEFDNSAPYFREDSRRFSIDVSVHLTKFCDVVSKDYDDNTGNLIINDIEDAFRSENMTPLEIFADYIEYVKQERARVIQQENEPKQKARIIRELDAKIKSATNWKQEFLDYE